MYNRKIIPAFTARLVRNRTLIFEKDGVEQWQETFEEEKDESLILVIDRTLTALGYIPDHKGMWIDDTIILHFYRNQDDLDAASLEHWSRR